MTPYVEGSRVWGIGGRGGAGKSTIIDELLYRFLQAPAPDGQSGRVAVLSADPTLGDRLRMLYCYSPRVFLRSVRVGPGESTEAKLEAVTPGDTLAILVPCHLCCSPTRAVRSAPGCY